MRAVVREVMRGLEARTGEKVQHIERIWWSVVGEDLAEFTRVRGITRGAVAIEAVGSAVLAELKQFYSGTFLSKLREEGIDGVDRMTFHSADG